MNMHLMPQLLHIIFQKITKGIMSPNSPVWGDSLTFGSVFRTSVLPGCAIMFSCPLKVKPRDLPRTAAALQ